jgi:hypothetical protein
MTEKVALDCQAPESMLRSLTNSDNKLLAKAVLVENRLKGDLGWFATERRFGRCSVLQDSIIVGLPGPCDVIEQ